jgi:MoaA/NifB/PqqE/SkfB family radical SAM enzyme
LAANQSVITDVAFSLEDTTREVHDKWRGAGSFDRVIKAISRCYGSHFPFAIKIVIRRDNFDRLEEVALFAARMGASALNFVHMMPTSQNFETDSSLTLEERRLAEQEIAILKRIFKMYIGIDVGYYNVDPRPPCSPLAGTSMNIDYQGRLTLCCNLSGFRGAESQGDVVADLKTESFAVAYQKYRNLASTQLKRRVEILEGLSHQEITPDLHAGSPCLLCLQCFGKIPWYETEKALTVRR